MDTELSAPVSGLSPGVLPDADGQRLRLPVDGSVRAPSLPAPSSGQPEGDRERQIARNAARRKADQLLVEELKLQGFQGPAYAYFEAELAAYAFPVLMSWMHSGEIFARCADKGRPVATGGVEPLWEREDRIEIADLTVARALMYFHDNVLLPGLWDPEAGTTLTTFFMGACVLQFPNQFRRVMMERKRWRRAEAAEAFVQARVSDRSDPLMQFVDQESFETALAALGDGDLRTAAEMIVDGHTYAEAAARIGISAAALSERFRRRRNRRADNPGGQA
ncbi:MULTISPECIES: hypothetical protein [Streptacidiphilus]|uniref:Sigma-70 family RNA polymerase sigma factor n=1 Tax=Streptacidiphilus cavernicola TaxID=3342716 RepID=A0ABV6V1F5_9ACTN|nr:hypothetical protein [Streptacidiphilus jeojiense]